MLPVLLSDHARLRGWIRGMDSCYQPSNECLVQLFKNAFEQAPFFNLAKQAIHSNETRYTVSGSGLCFVFSVKPTYIVLITIWAEQYQKGLRKAYRAS